MSNSSIIDIVDILNDYSSDIQDSITEVAQKVAQDGANKLKLTSPSRTGKYKKGWRVKTTKAKGMVESVIYNSTSPQLTHLLERTHATRNGGSTTPKSAGHIENVEKQCIELYEKQVEAVINNGGKV